MGFEGMRTWLWLNLELGYWKQAVKGGRTKVAEMLDGIVEEEDSLQSLLGIIDETCPSSGCAWSFQFV